MNYLPSTTLLVVTSLPVVAGAGVVTIEERYITALEPESNIDSVAVAPAGNGQPALLFATAKETDVMRVFDATAG